MRKTLALLLALCSLASNAEISYRTVQPQEVESTLPVLDHETLPAAIRNHDMLWVLFHDPDETHSQAAPSEFDKLAREYHHRCQFAHFKGKTGPSDESVKQSLRRWGVPATPAVKLFRGGNETSHHYTGHISYEGLKSYLEAHLSNSITELNSLEDIEKFAGVERFTVVGFFDAEDSSLHAYMDVAKSFQHKYEFGFVQESPRKWLETAAIPDWLGIDCRLDSASFIIVTYHSSSDGFLHRASIDLFHPHKKNVLDRTELTAFIQTRSIGGMAKVSREEVVAMSGRSSVPILIYVREAQAQTNDVRHVESMLNRAASKLRGLATVVNLSAQDLAEIRLLPQDKHPDSSQHYRVILWDLRHKTSKELVGDINLARIEKELKLHFKDVKPPAWHLAGVLSERRMEFLKGEL